MAIIWNLINAPPVENYKPKYLFCERNSTIERKPRNNYRSVKYDFAALYPLINKSVIIVTISG